MASLAPRALPESTTDIDYALKKPVGPDNTALPQSHVETATTTATGEKKNNHMNIREVRKTANDALLSKLSASLRGYFHDDFLQYYAFPITAESEPLMLPNLQPQHDIVIQQGKFPTESKYQIPDVFAPFHNTPFYPLPGDKNTIPSPPVQKKENNNMFVKSKQEQEQNDDNNNNNSQQQKQQQQEPNVNVVPNPKMSTSGLSGAEAIAQMNRIKLQQISQLPPSLHPRLPAIVAPHIQPRRSPLINKGYACRVHALDKIVVDFIMTCENQGLPSQIFSMGAGYDTTYWRLKYHHGIHATHYIELDFPHTMSHKLSLIHHEKNTPLLDVINSYSPSQYNNVFNNTNNNDDNAIPHDKMYTTKVYNTTQTTTEYNLQNNNNNNSTEQSSNVEINNNNTNNNTYPNSTPFISTYHDFSIIGCDARDIVTLKKCLNETLWNPSYPTLILFECVLVYIPPQAANDMLMMLSNLHQNVTMVAVYEQMHPHDPFGRTMVDNLLLRGCPLLSLHTYPDLRHQRLRFQNLQFQYFTGWSLAQITQHFTPCPGVEVLDEMEEYHLMSSHYTIYMALKNLDKINNNNNQKNKISTTPDDDENNNNHDMVQYATPEPILCAETDPAINNCCGDYDWCTSTLNPQPYQSKYLTYAPQAVRQQQQQQLLSSSSTTTTTATTTTENNNTDGYDKIIKLQHNNNNNNTDDVNNNSNNTKTTSVFLKYPFAPNNFADIAYFGRYPPVYAHTKPIVRRNGRQLIAD